ncbi:MAG: sigma-54-dependent Fis family transcriptional regulator [Nitrospirae bacterium]|nr:sigma-54-dependent Fis family transcriptional regulator [Nitrospirota bacterium]
MNPSVLLIDDDKTIMASLSFLFKGRGCEVLGAHNAKDGIRLAGELQPDLTILDHNLPDMTGIEALQGIKAVMPEALVIMLTGYGSISGAVEAIRAGAFDYLTKPVDIGAIEIAADRAFAVQGLKNENQLLRKLQAAALKEGIVGGSPQTHKLLLMINLLAENPNTTVLIEGESGTGKELAARTIHRMSARRSRPMVDINCASLSETFLESELFGHEKGAFTDAKGLKKGLIEVADGGTLFLDEIGELSQSLQPKLLRVLETMTFRRIGGTRDIKVDVRVIAATNRNLAEAVEQKTFREDLYYRLRVMPITMPPLRERREDIMTLARHFLAQMNAGIKKSITGISPDCEKRLVEYGWPGNVRELKNVIERAVIVSPGPFITQEHLPWELTRPGNGQKKPAAGQPLTLDEAEKAHIASVMERAGGNKSSAARILGISRSTLIAKLKKYE